MVSQFGHQGWCWERWWCTPLRVTCVLSRFSHIQLFVTPWTIAHQAPLSMGFSRQEYWSRLPSSPPGDLPNPGIKLESLSSPALADRFFTTSTTWEAPFDPQKSTEIPFKCCFSVKNCGLSTIFNTVRPWWKYRSWVFTVLGFPSKTLERSKAHHRDPTPGFPWAVVWTWAVPHSHSIRNKMGGGRVLYTSQLFSSLCSSPHHRGGFMHNYMLAHGRNSVAQLEVPSLPAEQRGQSPISRVRWKTGSSPVMDWEVCHPAHLQDQACISPTCRGARCWELPAGCSPGGDRNSHLAGASIPCPGATCIQWPWSPGSQLGFLQRVT